MCVYICMYLYIYICICICICICMCMYMYVYICICLCICICICLCICICICICVWACACVRCYIYICTHTHIHVYMHIISIYVHVETINCSESCHPPEKHPPYWYGPQLEPLDEASTNWGSPFVAGFFPSYWPVTRYDDPPSNAISPISVPLNARFLGHSSGKTSLGEGICWTSPVKVLKISDLQGSMWCCFLASSAGTMWKGQPWMAVKDSPLPRILQNYHFVI